jgi:hypothetical protein
MPDQLDLIFMLGELYAEKRVIEQRLSEVLAEKGRVDDNIPASAVEGSGAEVGNTAPVD